MNVLVWDHYPSHLEQENNCYSICTKQISKAVQFIRANYRHKVLEVISTRHILLSFRHRPSALLWIRVLPAWLHNGLLVQPDFWVVQPADTAKWLLYCKDFLSSTLISEKMVLDEIKSKLLMQITDWQQGKQSCQAVTAGRSFGSGLQGCVCLSCFVIPSNWPSLHPTLPYQGMARGETDHGGG